MPRHIEYPSLDGRSVPALLYQPPERRMEQTQGLPPAVIVIHGGPTWLFQFLWYPLMTHLASLGWVVLAPNYRGSSGYGREWQLANRFDMGRGDTMDVAAGVGLPGQGRPGRPAPDRGHRAQPRRLPDHVLPDRVSKTVGMRLGGGAFLKLVHFAHQLTPGFAALGYREHGRPGQKCQALAGTIAIFLFAPGAGAGAANLWRQ